jgi:hypothetical protein
MTGAVVLMACGAGSSCSDSEAQARNQAADQARPTMSDTALRRMAIEIQPVVERASGLVATAPLHVALGSREELEAYLLNQLEEQLPPEQAAALTAAYARFGLVPDTLDLSAVLVELYREQVVGFYDPRRDTLYVMDRVDEQLEMVLAHELVHALQDQHVDLDSLTTLLVSDNDRGTAVQAAIEGQATLAMIEWQMGVDVTLLPDLGQQFAGVDIAALGEAAGMPSIGNVPRVLREALIFPYIGGLIFVQRLWSDREGRPPPFGPDLPTSTEQLLHPERFADPRDEPTAVRFHTAAEGEWVEVYTDGLGELETKIFFEEHLTEPAEAELAAAGWDGDRYRLLRGPAGEVLIWATVWDSLADATEFAGAVTRAMDARYASDGGVDAAGRRIQVESLERGGRPTVLLVDSPAAFQVDSSWALTLFEIEP